MAVEFCGDDAINRKELSLLTFFDHCLSFRGERGGARGKNVPSGAKTSIPLTKNLLQLHHFNLGILPSLRLEAEDGLIFFPFWNGRKLQEVAHQDQLNATERSIILSNRLSNIV